MNDTFTLKDLGNLTYFLGVQISKTPNSLQISQQKYIQDIITHNKMCESKPVSTRADPSVPLTLHGDPFPDPKLYIQIVGSLQYATITKLDIAFAVNQVCQFMHAPTTLHWQAVKRILQYLSGTLHHCLHFKPHKATSLLAHSDSGWISDKEDSRSQYDFAIFHGENLIS